MSYPLPAHFSREINPKWPCIPCSTQSQCDVRCCTSYPGGRGLRARKERKGFQGAGEPMQVAKGERRPQTEGGDSGLPQALGVQCLGMLMPAPKPAVPVIPRA